MAVGPPHYRSLVIILLLALATCRTPGLQDNPQPTRLDLLDHKISFLIPSGWTVEFSEKRYFQLTANTNDTPYSPGIEYRGLTTDLTDSALMDQYARGWYSAMARNFPNFEYTDRKEFIENKMNTYYFEGTFSDGRLQLKKIGYLRFANRKIHAIYYTAPLAQFEAYLPLFKVIDKQIRFLN